MEQVQPCGDERPADALRDPLVELVANPTEEGLAALRCFLAGSDARALALLRPSLSQELRGEIDDAHIAWLHVMLVSCDRLKAGKALTWSQVWAEAGPAATRLRELHLGIGCGRGCPPSMGARFLDAQVSPDGTRPRP